MKQPLQPMKTDPFTSPPLQSLKSMLKNLMLGFNRIKLQAPVQFTMGLTHMHGRHLTDIHLLHIINGRILQADSPTIRLYGTPHQNIRGQSTE